MSRLMCALVWEAPDRVDEVSLLVDELLVVAGRHGATLVDRLTRAEPTEDADPCEVVTIEWDDPLGFRSFVADTEALDIHGRNRAFLANWQTIWVERH